MTMINSSFWIGVAVLSLLFSAIASFFSAALYDKEAAIGLLVGAIWAILNAYLLFSVLINFMENSSWRRFALLAIKFPILYFSGYFLLKTFSPLFLLAGFSLVLIVIVICGLATIFSLFTTPKSNDEM